MAYPGTTGATIAQSQTKYLWLGWLWPLWWYDHLIIFNYVRLMCKPQTARSSQACQPSISLGTNRSHRVLLFLLLENCFPWKHWTLVACLSIDLFLISYSLPSNTLFSRALLLPTASVKLLTLQGTYKIISTKSKSSSIFTSTCTSNH